MAFGEETRHDIMIQQIKHYKGNNNNKQITKTKRIILV